MSVCYHHFTKVDTTRYWRGPYLVVSMLWRCLDCKATRVTVTDGE